jgi:hypothetical protein
MGDMYPFLRVGGKDYLSFLTVVEIMQSQISRVLDPPGSTTPLLSEDLEWTSRVNAVRPTTSRSST